MQKFYGERAAGSSPRPRAIGVTFNSIPHDNIRQQFALDAMSAAGGFDVYIADQPWLPEFAEKGFIIDLTDKIDPGRQGRFRGRALETVSWGGKIYALRSSCTIARCITAPICSAHLASAPGRRRGTSIASGRRTHQGRRLRNADRRQAGYRGDDAAALLHPAGRRRYSRRQQQAELRLRRGSRRCEFMLNVADVDKSVRPACWLIPT